MTNEHKAVSDWAYACMNKLKNGTHEDYESLHEFLNNEEYKNVSRNGLKNARDADIKGFITRNKGKRIGAKNMIDWYNNDYNKVEQVEKDVPTNYVSPLPERDILLVKPEQHEEEEEEEFEEFGSAWNTLHNIKARLQGIGKSKIDDVHFEKAIHEIQLLNNDPTSRADFRQLDKDNISKVTNEICRKARTTKKVYTMNADPSRLKNMLSGTGQADITNGSNIVLDWFQHKYANTYLTEKTSAIVKLFGEFCCHIDHWVGFKDQTKQQKKISSRSNAHQSNRNEQGLSDSDIKTMMLQSEIEDLYFRQQEELEELRENQTRPMPHNVLIVQLNNAAFNLRNFTPQSKRAVANALSECMNSSHIKGLGSEEKNQLNQFLAVLLPFVGGSN
jgi:hypothetical protein